MRIAIRDKHHQYTDAASVFSSLIQIQTLTSTELHRMVKERKRQIFFSSFYRNVVPIRITIALRFKKQYILLTAMDYRNC
ncbi:hypothetical protein VNO77_13643 [Canavalia gladiata]|uniref:Uncharacterized protein n=1 Tax=Canavalia gladiata TaxID=3824 RepID=A0AAN9LXI1_CANGL